MVQTMEVGGACMDPMNQSVDYLLHNMQMRVLTFALMNGENVVCVLTFVLLEMAQWKFAKWVVSCLVFQYCIIALLYCGSMVLVINLAMVINVDAFNGSCCC